VLTRFPIAAAVALVLVLLPPTRFLLGASFAMELHELGHAVILWLGSRMAIPLPMITFSLGEGRSILVFVLFTAAVALALRAAWRERCLTLASFLALLLLLVPVLSLLPAPRHKLLVDAGGVGGEIWIAALLVIAWFERFPEALRWARFRTFFLGVGMAVWAFSLRRWIIAMHDADAIPWGSFFGGDGDMEHLVEAGLSPHQIRTRYFWMTILFGAAMAARWGVACWPIWRRTASPRR
jgi:hypothetical protein